MLSLRSKRWKSLKSHFEDFDIPALITKWKSAVGTYEEEYAYEDLRESFLHQQTILNVAYAVVPHLVDVIDRLDEDRRIAVLDDIEDVEATRLTPKSEIERGIKVLRREVSGEILEMLIQDVRDRYAPLPDDLAEPYLAAVKIAKKLAGKTWGKKKSHRAGAHLVRRHVRFLRENGVDDHAIITGIETLKRQGPDGFAPVHMGVNEARAALGEANELVVRALFSLAWAPAKSLQFLKRKTRQGGAPQ